MDKLILITHPVFKQSIIRTNQTINILSQTSVTNCLLIVINYYFFIFLIFDLFDFGQETIV